MQNRTACQILGNLCVLLHYNYFDGGGFSESNACMEYRKLMTGGSSSLDRSLWPSRAPWLYYGLDTKAELSKNNVPNKFKVNSAVKLIAFRYNANGVLVGVSELDPDELQLCQESDKSAESGFTFGTNYDKQCTMTAKELWKGAPTTEEQLIFYDLYLLSTEGKRIYPIPIQVTNLKRNDEYVNRKEAEHWQLVRRMFVREAISGIAAKDAKNANSVVKKDMSSSLVVRYARSIELDINLRDMNGEGTIYPPLIIVTYDELTKEDIAKGTEVQVQFKVTYWMTQDGAQRDISVSLAVLCSCGVLWSMFRTWSWAKRAGKLALDPAMIGKFLVTTAGILANVFFIVNACAAINWFVLYKKQSVIHTLLPTPEQERFLYVYISIAFVLKFVQVIHELAICCTINLFFIDWERPKVRPPVHDPKPKSAEMLNKDDDKDKDVESGLARRNSFSAGVIGRSSEKIALQNTPAVSIWRTYFVANEWIKLCGQRRLNLAVHIVLVIFSLNVSFATIA